MSIAATPELGPAKGLPVYAPADLKQVETLGWSVFSAGFHLPLAILLEPALRHNSRTMAAYCARNRVSFAPHGKTTMAPELFQIQLDDGAWAISAATVWQARTMFAAGVPRVLIANEVVTTAEIQWLAELSRESLFEAHCFVDSLAGVQIMEHVLVQSSPRRPLNVLVELGLLDGRTGARTLEDALAVARAVRHSRHLKLRGVAGFEGILLGGPNAHMQVHAFLREVHRLAISIDEERGFDTLDEVIITAGGSAYFDHVVKELSNVRLSRPVRVVLRSGCYLTHDDGGYDPQLSPMGQSPRLEEQEGRFRAALEVWGAVLSRPEPTRAIVGIGKRDISSDAGMPPVRAVRRTNGELVQTSAAVVRLNDQHAFLDVAADSVLAVGDWVALGVPHPCTTFDKWRVIPMVDDQYRVRKMIRTYF